MTRSLASRGVKSGPAANCILAVLACAVFMLGAMTYVLERPTDAVPFFSAISLAHLLSSVFGPIGESLPTFAHVFALSVLTTVWLGGDKRAAVSACLNWFAVDTAFEIGQHPQIAEWVAQFIPRWFQRLPILEQADAYFLSGTYDTWDLVSIAVGAAAAYVITVFEIPKDIHHE